MQLDAHTLHARAAPALGPCPAQGAAASHCTAIITGRLLCCSHPPCELVQHVHAYRDASMHHACVMHACRQLLATAVNISQTAQQLLMAAADGCQAAGTRVTESCSSRLASFTLLICTCAIRPSPCASARQAGAELSDSKTPRRVHQAQPAAHQHGQAQPGG